MPLSKKHHWQISESPDDDLYINGEQRSCGRWTGWQFILLFYKNSSTICSLCGGSVQIQNTLLHKNKNTFTLPSRKSTTSPCLFICSRNLLIESLNTRREAFSSITVSLSWDWPQCKCSESKRKPSLVLGSTPYMCSLSLQITRDFLFLYLGPCPSSVCVYSVQKNPNRKPQDLFGIPDQLLHTRKTNPLFHYYVHGSSYFQSLSCLDIG